MPAANVVTSTVGSAGGMLSPGMKTGLAITAAFVLYLIAANRLGVYIGLITGGSAPQTAVGTGALAATTAASGLAQSTSTPTQ